VRQALRKALQVAEVARATLVSALLGGNLATLTLVHRPAAAFANVQYGLFGWRMIKKQGLQARQLHELIALPEVISIQLLPTTSYLTHWDATYAKDAVNLAMLAKALSPRVVFEIGTFHGYTATLFALNSPEDTLIYTLDLPPDGGAQPSLATTFVDDAHIASRSLSGYLYSAHPQGRKVHQLFGDSATFDYSPYRGTVDIFFIDGAHDYEYVRSDTLAALSCMRPGGVVLWHDYGRWGVNGVSRWLHELAQGGREVFRLPGSSLAILRV